MFRFPITWIILLLLSLFGRIQAQHQHYYKSVHSDQIVFGAKNDETAELLDQSSDFYAYGAEEVQGLNKVYPVIYLIDADAFFTSNIGVTDNLNSPWMKVYLAALLDRSSPKKRLKSKLLEKKQNERQKINTEDFERSLTDRPTTR